MVRVIEPAAAKIYQSDERVIVRLPGHGSEPVVCEVEYMSQAQADHFPQPAAAAVSRPAAILNCVPGWDAVRLPLPATEMPTGFEWRADGDLLFSSLKGQVWRAIDTDRDGLPDTIQALSDELAAPYGVRDHGKTIDVINKNGLLRLSDFGEDGRAQRVEVVADGWGHSEDYHDWAVALVPDGDQGYYVGLPCRQNERADAAARLRGWVVHLLGREPTESNPRRYAIEPFSGGVRFPMGLARNCDGELFASDNQGNFQPFQRIESPGLWRPLRVLEQDRAARGVAARRAAIRRLRFPIPGREA